MHSTHGTAGGPGSRAAEFQTIQQALTAINTAGIPGEIRVAAGTYNTSQITITNDEVTLKGGYSNSNWATRNIATHTTTLNDSSSTPDGNVGVSFNFYCNACTLTLDGFTLNSTTDLAAVGSYVITIVAGTANLTNNTINETLPIGAAIIGMSTSDITVSNNTMVVSAEQGFGIAVAQETNLTATNNTITVTVDNNETAVGIYSQSQSAVASGNTINLSGNGNCNGFIVGSADDSNNDPITNPSYTIYSNKIKAACVASIRGFSVGSLHSGTLKAYNNYIYNSGADSQNFSISSSTGTVQIYNNTSVSAGTIANASIYISEANTGVVLDIQNNIFVASGAATKHFIERTYAAQTWSANMTIKNNNLYGFNFLITDGVIPLSTTTIANTESASPTTGTYLASGNFTEDPVLTNIATMDFSISGSSPANTRQGGLNGSGLGWGFTTDHAGTTRSTGTGASPTNANAAGWSVGAFEF